MCGADNARQRAVWGEVSECVLYVPSCPIVSDLLQPHGLQPAWLLCPWGFSRREYWNGLPSRPPGESFQPRDQTQVFCIAGRFFFFYHLSHQGSLRTSESYVINLGESVQIRGLYKENRTELQG